MLAAVLSGFCLAFAAPWVHKAAPRRSAWIFSLLPLAIFLYLLLHLPTVTNGGTIRQIHTWVPTLSVNLSFYLDGLSLLFSLLITGIGFLVVVYSGSYLAGHRYLGRFYLYLFLFMSSMLGMVLADNLITLFVFWELTSLSSFLLIGFDHGKESSRKAALQALLVTSAGGLALLAGFILMGSAGGSSEISALLSQGDKLRAHPLYPAILILVLLGAFTKSAQFPFHFWLPSAMEAPTPVSAYLHSATMVKAGIYLLARLAPVLGGTALWHYSIMTAGAVTMLAGGFLALLQTDLKRLLAYSTVSALGMLTLLIGIDTVAAIEAAAVYLLVHSLYKGALFMAAGAVDHETGTRNVEQLGGLIRFMPITGAAAVISALSMAGLPPLVGFIGKELVYEAKLQAPQAAVFITSAGFAANAMMVAAAAIVGIAPFLGKPIPTPKEPHRAPLGLLVGPIVLAILSLVAGIAPGIIDSFISSAVTAVRAEAITIKLSLWHGMSPVLLLGIATFAAGAAIYAIRGGLRSLPRLWPKIGEMGPARWYELSLQGMVRLAEAQTQVLQGGYLRHYLIVVLGVVFVLVGYALFTRVDVKGITSWPQAYFHEWIVAVIIIAAALTAVSATSRLAAIAALGAVGYGVAILFMLYGAPDLAMTQFCVETLSVILFVLILYRLPRFATLSSNSSRIRDIVVSLANGGLMTILVLTAIREPFSSRISDFFAQNSLPAGKGRNVVNVILVDFRSLDTLGETTVLAVAALGIYALLKAPSREETKK